MTTGYTQQAGAYPVTLLLVTLELQHRVLVMVNTCLDHNLVTLTHLLLQPMAIRVKLSNQLTVQVEPTQVLLLLHSKAMLSHSQYKPGYYQSAASPSL